MSRNRKGRNNDMFDRDFGRSVDANPKWIASWAVAAVLGWTLIGIGLFMVIHFLSKVG